MVTSGAVFAYYRAHAGASGSYLFVFYIKQLYKYLWPNLSSFGKNIIQKMEWWW